VLFEYVMVLPLHYDDSSRDDWAVEWFEDPRCTNGYTWLVLDDGRVVELADPAYRTPHAGPCRTPKANSAFYGIAAATNGLTLATEPQLDSIARLCAAVFRAEHWDAESIERRIVGHDREAIWTPDHTADRT
jgi:N-acetyl-anhydromuramyl-L-alanine amidase AmpD